jgi:hypothetical protein
MKSKKELIHAELASLFYVISNTLTRNAFPCPFTVADTLLML